MLKVSEIFTSIEGEGARSGFPCVFVRLYGCNLRCSYCDSMYANEGNDYNEMSVNKVISLIKDTGIHRVTVTGGEPLSQTDTIELLEELVKNKFKVNLETNGSVSLASIAHIDSDYLMITMDWKSISSNMSSSMLDLNIKLLIQSDVLKFVVSTEKDLDQMKEVLNTHRIRCQVFVSPIFGKIDPKDIVKYLIDNKIENVRLQLQIHKIIWDPEERGV